MVVAPVHELLVDGECENVVFLLGGLPVSGDDVAYVSEAQEPCQPGHCDPEVNRHPVQAPESVCEIAGEVEGHGSSPSIARWSASATRRAAISRSLTFSRCDAFTKRSKAWSPVHRCAFISMPLACSMRARWSMASPSRSLSARESQ